MKAHSIWHPIAAGIWAALFAAIAGWQHVQLGGLRAARAGGAHYVEERMRFETEIAGLKERLAAGRAHVPLDAGTKDLSALQATAVSAVGSKARFVVAANFVPAGAWKNAGTATPRASLETSLYALEHFDVDAWLTTVHFSKEAEDKAVALFAGLPPEAKAEFETPEKLVGYLAVETEGGGMTSAVILAEATDDSGKKDIRLERTNPDGRIRVTDLAYGNFAGAYQTIVRGDYVDMFVDLATKKAANSTTPRD